MPSDENETQRERSIRQMALMCLLAEVYSIINGQWETCLAPYIPELEPPNLKKVSLLLGGTNSSLLDYIELSLDMMIQS